ncbi:MAG: ATP-grasp domain-containing protein [Methanomicrobiales archaeon]|nr:ATP-grasp domain-containing protein [Methanomicrobiales archaeon]
MQKHILVAGFSTRHVVQSAYKAGYATYAVDHFCDQDLFWYTRDRIRFEEIEEIPGCIRMMCEKHPIDYLVVTSGAEHVKGPVPLLGTPPDRLDRFLDKRKTSHFFEEERIPAPGELEEGKYPVMVKPVRGAGGWRNRILHDDTEKEAWLREFPNVPAFYQTVIQGIPASVSCLADGKRAIAIAINEQILRRTTEAPCGFAGSITPIVHPLTEEMIALAEEAAGVSGCIGSIGVDFVLSDRVWAIEINPRFQATVDTVEKATGCNLFDLHVRACSGRLPGTRPETKCFAAKGILFADRDLDLAVDLSRFAPGVADIPWPGTHFEKGSAIISVYGHGPTRDAAERLLNTNITGIRRYIQQ